MSPTAEDDWLRVYETTIRSLYGYVSRRCGGDRELAEDVTQEVWCRALAAWRDRGLPEAPAAWLRTAARNLLANHYRRRRPEVLSTDELDLSEPEEPPTPRAAALLNWGLAHLGPKQASLLEAFHFEGKGVAAIAAELGLSERAVEGRLRRSRGALRDRIDPYLRGDER